MVIDFLNTNKGIIHEQLIDSHFIKTIPWISFVYDVQASGDRDIENRLAKVRHEFEKFQQKSQDVPEATKVKFEPKLEKQINFQSSIEEFDLDEYQKKTLHNSNSVDVYKNLKFRKPEDMIMNVLNLDYEGIMDKVLKNMSITRAQHRQSNLYGIGEHLPPITPADQNESQPPVSYNTEERIKAIRKFAIMNKKQKNKFSSKHERLLLDEENARLEDYQQLHEIMDEQYAKTFEDVEHYTVEPSVNDQN